MIVKFYPGGSSDYIPANHWYARTKHYWILDRIYPTYCRALLIPMLASLIVLGIKGYQGDLVVSLQPVTVCPFGYQVLGQHKPLSPALSLSP